MKNIRIGDTPLHIVAGLHGNERAPVRALQTEGYAFIHGNPEAYEQGVRYIEKDLNASFGTQGVALEEQRAREILMQIEPESLVVDFHTTSSASEPFVILTDIHMLPLAMRTGLPRAVLMTHNIKEGHALINHRNGISIEMTGHDTEESFATTLSVIRRLAEDRSSSIEVFEVFGRITEPGEYTNFALCEAGFFPIFTGETTYDFIGLKARKIDIPC